jgi:hypothetical protein
MGSMIRRVEYFYVNVEDHPGEGYKLLSQLAQLGINQLAFTAVPVGVDRAQLAVFPEDPGKLIEAARQAKIGLDGPHRALLVQGDDKMGAFAEVHGKLYDASVNVYASSGVTDGRGAFGYVIYVRPEDFDRAAKALEV